MAPYPKMAPYAAAGSAAAAVIGDVISAGSQSNMNLANRTFSAQQAELNRQFQAQQVQQQEAFQERMSDTQISRRVADLKSAGINPLLAGGQLGGASSPMGSAAPGSQASTPNTTAPGTAYQNLGQATATAAQTYAQVELANAQAAKTKSETPTPQYLETTVNPDGTTSLEVNANAGHELGDQQLASQKAVIAKINSDIGVNASVISLNEALEAGRGLDNQLLGDTLAGLVKARNANSALEATTSQSGQNVMGLKVAGTNLGTWIEALRLIIGSSKGH